MCRNPKVENITKRSATTQCFGGEALDRVCRRLAAEVRFEGRLGHAGKRDIVFVTGI